MVIKRDALFPSRHSFVGGDELGLRDGSSETIGYLGSMQGGPQGELQRYSFAVLGFPGRSMGRHPKGPKARVHTFRIVVSIWKARPYFCRGYAMDPHKIYLNVAFTNV